MLAASRCRDGAQRYSHPVVARVRCHRHSRSGCRPIVGVMHQIDWYEAQGMVKPETDGTKIVDKRYVVALPGT